MVHTLPKSEMRSLPVCSPSFSLFVRVLCLPLLVLCLLSPLIFLIFYETVRNLCDLFVRRTGQGRRRIAGGCFPYGGNAEVVLLWQEDDAAILGNDKHLNR